MYRSGAGVVSASGRMGDKERRQAQMGSDADSIGLSTASCRRFCRPVTIIYLVDSAGPSLEDSWLRTGSVSESAEDCKFLNKSV